MVPNHSHTSYDWRQFLPLPSLPNAFLSVGYWLMPSKGDREKFAAIAKTTPTLQTKEYHIESPDDEPLYTEEALAQEVNPDRGVEAKHYANLKASELDVGETPDF